MKRIFICCFLFCILSTPILGAASTPVATFWPDSHTYIFSGKMSKENDFVTISQKGVTMISLDILSKILEPEGVIVSNTLQSPIYVWKKGYGYETGMILSRKDNEIFIDASPAQMSLKPLYKNQTIYVGLREFLNAIGQNDTGLKWDEEQKTILITSPIDTSYLAAAKDKEFNSELVSIIPHEPAYSPEENKIIMEWQNNTDKEITYGMRYELFEIKEGQRQKIDVSRDIDDIAFTVSPGSKRIEEYSLPKNIFLSKGQYIFKTEFIDYFKPGVYDTYILEVPFHI